MNLRQFSFLLISLLLLLMSLGNKNGRASAANRGNTGAPGDELSGGQPRTCINCHNQGPITASLSISVLDAAGNAVTQYMPGAAYTARVKITAAGTDLSGYGFQMIALRDNGNTDLDGFSDMNPNNYKLVSISNGRTYAEHDNVSAVNTFDVKWTAPAAGAGSVTFYAAGNGVNGNGNTGGDGAALNSLRLTEFGTVDAPEATSFPGVRVFPNPVAQTLRISLGSSLTGECRVSVFDLAGRQVMATTAAGEMLASGLEISAETWKPGTYVVRLENAGRQSHVKVVKL